MKTFGTMFTGGELFGVGAVVAGYTPLWGLEKDDGIASVARLNGFPVITADVIEFDYSTLERPDHIHASPPCPNFSLAKTGAKETELDIKMADAVCRALKHFKPDTFSLEQVVGYRNSESFKKISKVLSDLGYWWDATNLNAADFGVPQTRVRLWVRASRGLLRGYPPPVKWKGWYQAIEDLIPSLPDAEFAPWQIARLPEEYKEFMIGQGTFSNPISHDEPAQTITANRNQKGIRAFIFNGAVTCAIDEAEPGKGVRYEDEPAQTLASAGGGRIPKAFVLDGQANDHGESVTIRHGEDPIFTMSASAEKRPARAFVGRVVKLDIRCLGRFQTVPDSYKGLTVKINGNGCPCLEAQRVLETL